MPITLPNNWAPRRDQLKLWSYLERGGKRAVECAHRRWGKDDVALHWTAMAANDVGHSGAIGRVGTYWHMLPKANQARKAIWEAVNARTGKRRIDEAFPRELRSDTRETDMFIRFKNGSTFQIIGSDRYDASSRMVVFAPYFGRERWMGVIHFHAPRPQPFPQVVGDGENSARLVQRDIDGARYAHLFP